MSAGLAYASPVEVSIGWKYSKIPPKMRIWELRTDSDAPDWQTGVSTGLAGLPVSGEIKDSHFELEPGATKRFVLVFENDTSRPVEFFAAPHSLTPPEAALGHEFWCLCTGDSYVVPPRHYWYRVVRLRLGKDFEGKNVRLVHRLMTKRPPADGWQPSNRLKP